MGFIPWQSVPLNLRIRIPYFVTLVSFVVKFSDFVWLWFRCSVIFVVHFLTVWFAHCAD